DMLSERRPVVSHSARRQEFAVKRIRLGKAGKRLVASVGIIKQRPQREPGIDARHSRTAGVDERRAEVPQLLFAACALAENGQANISGRRLRCEFARFPQARPGLFDPAEVSQNMGKPAPYRSGGRSERHGMAADDLAAVGITAEKMRVAKPQMKERF